MMDLKEIQELIKHINKTNISEFKLKDGEFSIAIRTKSFTEAINTSSSPSIIPVSAQPMPQEAIAQAPNQQVAQAATTQASEEKPAEVASNTITIKSPMVGTFYRRPAPDKDAFVKVGDTISVGDKLCVVEAMKLFNEIEAEVSGKIVKVLVDDSSPVEYDQPLFEIEPEA